MDTLNELKRIFWGFSRNLVANAFTHMYVEAKECIYSQISTMYCEALSSATFHRNAFWADMYDLNRIGFMEIEFANNSHIESYKMLRDICKYCVLKSRKISALKLNT